MKKLVLLTMMLVSNLMLAHAQTDTIMYVIDLPGEWHYICYNRYQTATIYAPDGCNSYSWLINNQPSTDNSVVLDGNLTEYYQCIFVGGNCGQYSFSIIFRRPNVPDETTEEIWKHQYEPITLEAIGADSVDMYTYYWPHNGATIPTVEVTSQGTYPCLISDMCASATRTFIVQDNVEIHRATVDLETNLNKVTWQVIPEQAVYISEVKVERDGFVVGTAPYEQGYFTDNIGSENAARNYRLTGITPEGTECPIPSYQKGTLHVDYSPNASNPNKLNMAWTPPFIEEDAPVSVTYFQICKYDPTTGEVTVIDQLGANNTIASYNRDLFGGGYAVIGVVFNDGRADEEVSFSNRSEDIIMAVGEQQGEDFRIYPNPAQDRVTVEGTGTMTVTNILGQTIITKDIDGKTTIDLPQGMYFVKMGGITRKVVVE